MTLTAVLSQLAAQGIKLWAEGEQLRVQAPKGAMTPALRELIITNKAELLTWLQADSSPLQATVRPAVLPLSPVQQSLWLLTQIDRESRSYNEVFAFQIDSPIESTLLEQALAEVVRRHEALRTTFVADDQGVPRQVIHPPRFTLSICDLSQLSAQEQQTEIQRLVQAEGREAFDLEQGPLFRVQLLRLQSDPQGAANVMLSTMHHLIGDSWSFNIIIQEVCALYAAFAQGKPSPLAELPIQYVDYVLWQQKERSEEKIQQQLAYWQKELKDAPPLLPLPTDRPRPAQRTYVGAQVRFALDHPLTTQLRSLAQNSDATLFMVLLAAFNCLLGRYSQQEDIVVGVPIANRQSQEVAALIGFFANTIVLRTQLAGNPTFRTLLAQVKTATQQAYAHQEISFEQLITALQPPRTLNYSPVFQVMFAFQNLPTFREVDLTSLPFKPLDVEVGISKYDLTLSLFETAEELAGSFEYNSDLFDRETIVRMVGHFQTLLQGIVHDPNRSIAQLPLLTALERQQLLFDWATTATIARQERCIHHLFEEQVARTPDAIAVILEDEALTYRELNRQANQLAHYLRTLTDERGELLAAGAERRVGICMDRSLDLIVGVLAILKAGAVYVPLDATYPQERLAYMLADAQAVLLLTQAKYQAQFADTSVKLLCLEEMRPCLVQQPTHPPHLDLKPTCLAYVIYTSGSTGLPKGVMIEHQALSKHVSAIGEVYGITPRERILQFSAFSFDAAQEQIFEALTHGATLVLRKDELWTSEEFTRRVVGYGITLVELTPTYFQGLISLWQQERPPFLAGALRLIQVSSEPILPETVRQWQQLTPTTRLLNIYGPTEATVTATSFDLSTYHPDPWPANVPIGRPFPGRSAYILDQQLQPVPLGLYGELYMGGDSIGRGYLDRPALTAERFLDNPFVPDDAPVTQAPKLYKTGDVARWLPEPAGPPNLEFVGRVDHQVKLRGYRIELGEIEHALMQQPQVDYVLVLVREEVAGDKRLVAYLTVKEAAAQDRLPHELAATLRDALRKKLPDYMVPSAFIVLDRFPLMPNGKIDRAALPAPDQSANAMSSAFVPPTTPTEIALAAHFAALLRVDQIGLHDNFFDLGGHSLLLTQLFFRLREDLQVEITLHDLFAMPTIAQLTSHIETKQLGMQREGRIDFAREATLDPTIVPRLPNGWRQAGRTPSSSVLLTGGTGFLGAFLLDELLQQSQSTIYCLVRTSDQAEGMARLQANLTRYGLWREAYRKRIVPIVGDLALPRFGLAAEQFQALAAAVDAIYHNAALVTLIQPYESLKAVNVLGTQEVIRLAALGAPTPIHYVSTHSVFDAPTYFDGRWLYEDSELGNAQELVSGYAQSKWVAEKLLLAARCRAIPTTIYRPGIISGHSQSGAWNTADWFPRWVKGCIQLGAWPQTALDLNLIPVDYVSASIVTLSRLAGSANQIFHLDNPDFLQYPQLAEWLCTFGYPLRGMDVEQWLRELTQATSNSAENALAALLPLFVTSQSAAEQGNNGGILRRNGQLPRFDCTKTLTALAHTDIVCPKVDAPLFHRYLSYFMESNFLEAPCHRQVEIHAK